jgi:hypothetical protein
MQILWGLLHGLITGGNLVLDFHCARDITALDGVLGKVEYCEAIAVELYATFSGQLQDTHL